MSGFLSFLAETLLTAGVNILFRAIRKMVQHTDDKIAASNGGRKDRSQ